MKKNTDLFMIYQIETRGKTPMIKNIIVVDENGKKYGTTYLKRAKGLVRQGRARFTKPDVLCLACPPEQNLEDEETMESENIKTENRTTDSAQLEQIDTQSTGAEEVFSDNSAVQNECSKKYSMEYCLEQIERIGRQTEHLNQAIAELHHMDNDNASGEKALALGNIVECRETTNQQMLRFYEKMYDDLKMTAAVDVVSQKSRLQEQMLKIMDKTLENGNFTADEVTDLFNGAFDAIRHIND